MGYKKITISEIARIAGVSATTASMILSGRQGVSFSPITVETVEQVAKEHGYKPSQRHRPITKAEKIIIIACPNISNQYYSRIVQSIEQEAIANDYKALIFTHYRDPRQEQECLNIAMRISAQGIIYATMPSNIEIFEQVKNTLPIVVIGDRDSRTGVDTVELNDYGAGSLLASHLLSLGHRHLAFISTTLGERFAMRERRLIGIQDTLRQKCPEGTLCVYSHNVTPAEELGDIDIEYNVGFKLTSEALDENNNITGFIAVNDSVAAGVIDAIRAKGYKIPDDYSVCGCDNIRTSRYEFVSLTTVDHQLEEKGRYAFHILLKRMTRTNMQHITRIEYPNRLMARKSTGLAKRKMKVD